MSCVFDYPPPCLYTFLDVKDRVSVLYKRGGKMTALYTIKLIFLDSERDG